MRVLGIVGSMRRNRNTETLVRRVISEMEAVSSSLTSELVQTPELTCQPCRVVCHDANCSAHLFRCAIADDVMLVLEKMTSADVLVIGAPQYFRGPPAGFHAMIERMISMAYFYESATFSDQNSPFAGKPCGLVGVAEYSNPQEILEYLHDFCLLLGMQPVTLSSFPYLGVGGHGKLEKDDVFHPFGRAREMAVELISAVES
ncbi:flavodoxin family protein [Candidatus Bipolaricaulota bacterium]